MAVINIGGELVNIDASVLTLDASTQLAPGLTAGAVQAAVAALTNGGGGLDIEVGVPVVPSTRLVPPVIPFSRSPGYVDVEARLPMGPQTGPLLADGADLRDVPAIEGSLAALGVIPITVILAALRRVAPGMVPRLLAWSRQFAQGSRVAWDMLPAWLRTVLGVLGITAGVELVIDAIPGTTGEGMLPGFGLPDAMGGPPLGQVVGSWEANGVRFYRLADGKLAVQNKMGRWKVWRPKRPVVLYPGGAGNLRTLLRADAILTKQAHQLARMLARRTGTKRRLAKPTTTAVLVTPAQHALMQGG